MRRKLSTLLAGLLLAVGILFINPAPASAAGNSVYVTTDSQSCMWAYYVNGGYGNICPGQTGWGVREVWVGGNWCMAYWYNYYYYGVYAGPNWYVLPKSGVVQLKSVGPGCV